MLKRIYTLLLCLFISLSAYAQFTIIVDDIPDNTPVNDPIHIAGDFQGWNPGSAAHILNKDNESDIYSITLPAGTGDIQFKFTRGNWAKVESDANGKFIPNRFYSPSNGDTIYLQILGWEDLDGDGGGVSTAAENVHIITDSFYMPQFDRYRRVWIYLPPDYSSTSVSYPVLYMHDGQNVFDDLTSFVGEWEVDETLNALHADGDPGIIVVAVDNGQNLRIDEYTPWANPQYGGGDGEKYIEFMVQDLKPYIDSNYRTLPGRNHSGLMGSSLGGLISMYGGIEYQDIFSKIGAFSPSYWFNKKSFDHVVSTGKQEDMRIYQLGGSLEGSNLIPNMFAMEDTLHAAGFGADEVLTIESPDGQHSEWFWAREFEAAYKWLFRDQETSINEVGHNLNNIHLYPNPAKDVTTLEFYLRKSATVNIDIIDSSGQLLKAIYANTLKAGDHQVKLNLQKDAFPPGFYFCRIRSGKESIVLKLVIM